MLLDFFYQSIRPFLTTQPIHWILKKGKHSPFWGLKPFSTLIFKNSAFRKRYAQMDVNERIVEIPFIFQQITKTQSKILDIGCCESTVSISLATLGHQVTGVDIRPYELTHPNFTFRQEDIVHSDLTEKEFDYVLLLSTVEHIGLDTMYGDSSAGTDDISTLRKVRQLLNPNGTLLLTVPFARSFHQDHFMRRYDTEHLKRLLEGFEIKQHRYFAPNPQRTYWKEIKQSQVPDYPLFGVACVVASKVNG